MYLDVFVKLGYYNAINMTIGRKDYDYNYQVVKRTAKKL